MKGVLFAALVLALLACAGPAFAQEPDRSFDIGVPIGDAYNPAGLVVDEMRNLAYVSHGDSSDHRPVISVVDLNTRQVARLLRPDGITAGGGLILAPDRANLYLVDYRNLTLTRIDVTTGAVGRPIPDIRYAVLSEDGGLLYTAGDASVRAYRLADLAKDQAAPLWTARAPEGEHYYALAVNGDRVLTSVHGPKNAIVLMNAKNGREIKRIDVVDYSIGLAAGPDGGWAATFLLPEAALVRYDAALKEIARVKIPYVGFGLYDRQRGRYVIGNNEKPGEGKLYAFAARDLQKLAEATWPAQLAPTALARWGDASLVGLTPDGKGQVVILDANTLAQTGRVITGVRAEDVVADDAANRLYVADDHERIHVLSLPDGREVDVWEGGAPLALDAANGRLYANRAGRVVALALSDGSRLAEFPQAGHPAPDPQRELVYIADRGVTLYDRSGKKLGELPSTFPDPKGFSPNPAAERAWVNPVTGHLAVVVNNGIPGSNNGSFLRIYPPQADSPAAPQAPHSFVIDVITDRAGNWFVSYAAARSQPAVQVLSPDGKLLRQLDGRTGRLLLDEGADSLYLFLEGTLSRLAASTLTLTDLLQGPPEFTTMAYSPKHRIAYLLDGKSRIGRFNMDGLERVDLGPQPGAPPRNGTRLGMAGSLAVTSVKGRSVVFASFDGLYRTYDGVIWEKVLRGALGDYGYVTAAPDGTVFFTGSGSLGADGVWRSSDGGDTWELQNRGLPNLRPFQPILARSRDEAYFVDSPLRDTERRLFRWVAARQEWQPVTPSLSTTYFSDLFLAPDGALLLTDQGALKQSTDGGATWTAEGAMDPPGLLIGFSALYTQTHGIFATVVENNRITAIQRSQDRGKTWQRTDLGSQFDFSGYPPEVATGFGRSYMLMRPYNSPAALLRTTDFGATWQVAPATTVKDVEHIAVDPLDGRLWLAVPGGVRAVDPEKLRWTKVKAPQPTPTPTPAPAPTAGPCTQPLTGNDAEISTRGLNLGCPKGAAESIQMARQRFQHGQMIWRGDRKQIYVLYADGRWEGREDRWLEGQPADDPQLTPPAGLQQPVRGFGKVWREQLGGAKAALGWALEKEQGVQGLAQDWEGGIVLRFGGEVLVLLAGGEWR